MQAARARTSHLRFTVHGIILSIAYLYSTYDLGNKVTSMEESSGNPFSAATSMLAVKNEKRNN